MPSTSSTPLAAYDAISASEDDIAVSPIHDSRQPNDAFSPLKKHPTSVSLYVGLLASCAGLGGFLAGYDAGIVSGATLYIMETFNLTDSQISLVVSAVVGGAIIGGLGSSIASDKWGRRPVILIASVIFVFGALMMGLAASWVWLVLGRLVAGAAVGLAGGAIPVYLTEMAPTHIRGSLVSVNVFFITLGQFVSYLTAYALSDAGANNWRWMLGLSGVPAVVMAIGMVFLPESPRFLVHRGQNQEALRVLRCVRPESTSEEELMDELKAIRATSQSHEDEISVWAMVKTREYRSPLVIALGLQMLQQLSGINTVMYYSATILRMAGFPSKEGAILFSSAIALTNCLATVLSMYLIDRVGRRPLLLRTLIGTILGLVVLAMSFQSPPPPGTATAAGDSPVNGLGEGSIPFQSWVSLVSLVIYVGFYATGLGCVPWTVTSEVFPQHVRGKGTGVAIAANWFCNFMVAMTFLSLTKAITPSGTFLVYALIVAGGWCFVYRYVPETHGKTLEEISASLS
ncbi:general substrate transporter [Gaertneriomyces semiglobifer]|nr:general substrate transporter [Gaertneriomyces semiglobifer]KAI9004067.1 general substrate transporter [Gaertneriomyces semiglobifer]